MASLRELRLRRMFSQRDLAREAYNKALLKTEVGTLQRRLLELKLTDAGGTPPKTETQS